MIDFHAIAPELILAGTALLVLVADLWVRRKVVANYLSLAGTLAAAAALATLDVFERERILDRLPHTIERLRRALDRLRPLRAVGGIRQYGLAAGVELVADRRTGRPYPAAERRGMRVCRVARRRGVFLRPLGDVIVLMPPLTVTDEEIDLLVDAVAAGVEEVCGW